MQDEAEEWVSYHPPKSTSFGHQSQPRDPRKSWPLLQQFLADHAHFVLGPRLDLICHNTPPSTDAAVAAKRIEEARSLFGAE